MVKSTEGKNHRGIHPPENSSNAVPRSISTCQIYIYQKASNPRQKVMRNRIIMAFMADIPKNSRFGIDGKLISRNTIPITRTGKN